MSSDPAGTFKGYQTWPKVFHDLQSGSREVFTQSSKTEHGQPTLAPTEKPTGNNTGRLRIRNNNNHKSNVSHSADTLMNCKLTETVVNLSDHRANKGDDGGAMQYLRLLGFPIPGSATWLHSKVLVNGSHYSENLSGVFLVSAVIISAEFCSLENGLLSSVQTQKRWGSGRLQRRGCGHLLSRLTSLLGMSSRSVHPHSPTYVVHEISREAENEPPLILRTRKLKVKREKP